MRRQNFTAASIDRAAVKLQNAAKEDLICAVAQCSSTELTTNFPSLFVFNRLEQLIMQHGSGASHSEAATLNTVAAHGFGNGCRRIDRLRQLAYDCNLTDEQARIFGKLTQTATWEKLLLAHKLEFEPKSEIINDIVAPGNSGQTHSINLLEWVNLSQLLAVSAATAGLIILLLNLWPRINPFNLFPQVRINIEIGDK